MRLLAAGASALCLAACGAAAAPSAPAPTTPPSPAGPVLTNTDAGRTVTMKVGERIEVALRQENGFTMWENVTSTNPSVLQPVVDPRAAAVIGMSLHSFQAMATGQAQVTATATVQCSPGAACPALARDWRVTVIVS